MSGLNPLPSRLLVVTDRHQATAPIEEVVSEAIAAGARWFWLRDRDLAPAERRALASRLLATARRHDARLSIGGDVDLAVELAADGVHLAAGASVAAARARLGADAIIGVSVHAHSEIAAAEAAGADYLTLSPIYPTSSKPGYGPALGAAALARAAQCGLPVLALGGVTAARAEECLHAGAAGLAVMGEVMRARPGGIGDVMRAFSAALRCEVD
jgi:thiamine-phosphate pyrophosphorylase